MTHPTPHTSTEAGGPALTYSYHRSEHYPGRPCFTWAVVGPDGAIHIWAQANDDEHVKRWGERFTGGVECHWPVASDTAEHAECWLLKGPCRHDGSSLYFSENIAPMLTLENVESDGIASYIQSELRDWYRAKIGGAA